MNRQKGLGALVSVLALGVPLAALGQDAFPEPNTPARQGSVAEEATIGEIPAREDGQGTDRDAPEQDMQGSGAVDEPISGDGSVADPQQGRAEGSNDRSPASAEDDPSYRESERPGLDEPRQPIRPGQMEQERQLEQTDRSAEREGRD